MAAISPVLDGLIIDNKCGFWQKARKAFQDSEIACD